MLTANERIAQLEVKFEALLSIQTATNEKLDELLTLKNKGMGAFWLMSLIAGSGIIAWAMTMVKWIRVLD